VRLGTFRAVKKLSSLLAIVAFAISDAHAAEPPAPPTAADISGARALSLAATRGLAGGNEGIFLNAASLAARRRYSMELQWALDRVGDDNRSQFLGGSVVDSQIGSLTGGVAYTRISRAETTGAVYALALASPLSSRLFAGVTGKYLRLSGEDPANAATVDASLFYAIPGFSIGVSGYNLVPRNHDAHAPLGVGAGLAIGNERRYNLTADYRTDFDRAGRTTHAWGFGAELLAFGNFPLRGGFLRDETRDGKWWTAGVGVVSTTGLAIDLGYQQSLDLPQARVLAVALKMFLLAQ
jgi:hypothetical protein